MCRVGLYIFHPFPSRMSILARASHTHLLWLSELRTRPAHLNAHLPASKFFLLFVDDYVQPLGPNMRGVDATGNRGVASRSAEPHVRPRRRLLDPSSACSTGTLGFAPLALAFVPLKKVACYRKSLH